ncbi:DUF4352 domain-containing protein [Streptomyces sp. DH37]|uniref:DUF4352 domain-containing protein n=1 Tax=Streptomyces sp. DH37 TaxID=3040122 RepID=UPI0024419343|nr:DUF4352 domain-containing protein [Streptomyces sp. DH37]MDG9706267.1 DUF4352 domain-containing protein [Streptomyces sp. DH37]
MRTRTALAAAALLAALAGCSNGSDTEAASEPSPSTSKPAEKPTAEPTEEPGPLAFGEPWKWKSPEYEASGSATALRYQQPVKGVYPPSGEGEVWGSLEAQVCIDSGDVRVSQFPWSLAFADGARVDVTGQSGGDFPRPEFPMDAAVKPGDCVKGLIMFPVPEGQRPERVIYDPDSGMVDGPAEWTVPEK